MVDIEEELYPTFDPLLQRDRDSGNLAEPKRRLETAKTGDAVLCLQSINVIGELSFEERTVTAPIEALWLRNNEELMEAESRLILENVGKKHARSQWLVYKSIQTGKTLATFEVNLGLKIMRKELLDECDAQAATLPSRR